MKPLPPRDTRICLGLIGQIAEIGPISRQETELIKKMLPANCTAIRKEGIHFEAMFAAIKLLKNGLLKKSSVCRNCKFPNCPVQIQLPLL